MDTNLIFVILVLPSLFGLSLLGEGVHGLMNYDNRGWIGVGTGGLFLAVVIFAYLFVMSNGGAS
ncbi:MAG: hypothetical protein WCL07_01530 [bacterium]